MATTWWQELHNRVGIATTWQKFTKKSLTAPLVHLQESRKRTTLHVNWNSAVKKHQTSFKIHNQPTEEDRINYFHSLTRGDALQTFKNNNGPTWENLGEILAVFRTKYVKPQSMATTKHKFQKLVFNSANQKLIDFLNELQKLANDAFGIAAHAIIEQFIYAKRPPHLEKSIIQAHLENGTYEQIVTHLEKEPELNVLEAPDELQINTVSHNTANASADRPKPTCHHCKNPGHYINQCRLLKKQREQTENSQNNPGNKNSDANTSNPNSNVNNHDNNKNKNNNRAEKKPKIVYLPCEWQEKPFHREMLPQSQCSQ